jgi:hypothetical protein
MLSIGIKICMGTSPHFSPAIVDPVDAVGETNKEDNTVLIETKFVAVGASADTTA